MRIISIKYLIQTVSNLRQQVSALAILSCLVIFSIQACIEPYEGEVEGFDDVLVINAILTNEIKHQEVELSRSYPFEANEPITESKALVNISDGNGRIYSFEETTPGIYLSLEEFGAELSKIYTLEIITEDGKRYISKEVKLPTINTNIDDLYAERTTNNDGVEGIGIFVNTFDAQGNSNLYRHEYEETFKIVAPYWSPFDAVFVIEGVSTYDVRVILREREERVCYKTDPSKIINISSTGGFTEDRLVRHPIRFISQDDYILTHRYSILVKQYVQNPEAFNYYETLKGLSSSSGNVFSEDQPGFLAGNIINEDDPTDNVAGYFEVAAIDKKRIFLNYEDYFPGEPIPSYIVDCNLFAPPDTGSFGQRAIVNAIKDNTVRFYDYNRNPAPFEGPFIVVRPECGDCTTIGSNKIPNFWIE